MEHKPEDFICLINRKIQANGNAGTGESIPQCPVHSIVGFWFIKGQQPLHRKRCLCAEAQGTRTVFDLRFQVKVG